MQIQNLKGFPLVELVDCLSQSFANYYVPIPDDIKYWGRRFRGARVDRIYSFGALEGRMLVGFIMQGIDQYRGARTVFNTGTGVLPNYRGKALVDRMYEASWPVCQENKVEQCALEVIQENHRAIRVYQRNGFEISRELRSYAGKLDGPNIPLTISPLTELPSYATDDWVSWDFTRTAMLIGAFDYRHFEVLDSQQNRVGCFSIDHDRKLLARMDPQEGSYNEILSAVQKLYPDVRMVNVDGSNQDLIQALEQYQLANNVNQFEMIRSVP
ncbi:MAG: GNAT family N-acetyltransferase [Bacteroidota bacterium]